MYQHRPRHGRGFANPARQIPFGEPDSAGAYPGIGGGSRPAVRRSLAHCEAPAAVGYMLLDPVKVPPSAYVYDGSNRMYGYKFRKVLREQPA
jgi:hypothetical protein